MKEQAVPGTYNQVTIDLLPKVFRLGSHGSLCFGGATTCCVQWTIYGVGELNPGQSYVRHTVLPTVLSGPFLIMTVKFLALLCLVM